LQRLNLIYFLVIAIGISDYAVGQNITVIDSLHSKLKNAPESARFALLTSIGFEYRYSYPDSTIYYCTRAFELGKTLDYKKNLSRPLSFIGLAYNIKGDYKEALQFHQQAIEMATEQNDSIQLGHGYNNLGRMFFDGGDQVRSITNFFRAKEIFEALGDKSGLAYVYRSLASVYKAENDFSNAIKMSDKAYEFRRELGEKRGIISSLTELGLIYQLMDDMRSALDKFSQAEVLAQHENDKVTQAEVLMAIAEIKLAQGNIKEALENSREVLATISENTNQPLFIRASFVEARYLFMSRQYTSAISLLQKILTLSRNSGNLVHELEALKLIAECYDMLGDRAQALSFKDDYKLINEKLKNTDLLREIERLQFQLMIEKIENENKLLKADQVENKSLITQQRFQNIILVVLIVSLLLITSILLVFNKKRSDINLKLAENNEKIRQQQRAISETNQTLMARNRELSELNNEKDSLMSIVAHDLKAPFNRITGLVTLIEMHDGLNQEQKDYIQVIKSVSKSSSDLIGDLLDVSSLNETGHKPPIAQIDLKKLIESRISSYQLAAQLKSIEIEFTHAITFSFSSVTDYWNRIIDNLISNAIKFSSKNSKIFIHGATEEGFAIVTIKDQGPGFTEEDKQLIFQRFKRLSARPTGGESSNGLGLAIVKTLVDRMQGTITLNSTITEGSEFIIRIPVKDVTASKN
jgi:signal transduction histidine kinase